jgi:protein-tyrosine phosphatase
MARPTVVPIKLLFVCTANQCRSPMARALMLSRVAERGGELRVASAGFSESGYPSPRRVIQAMERVGLDLSGHVSRQISAELISAADLIATMTRQHLIDVVTLVPDAFARTFTLRDLVRRATAAGPPLPQETYPGWVTRLHGGRTRSSVLSLDRADDVADPLGGRPAAFDRTRNELDGLVTTLADLLFRRVASGA